MRPQNRQDDGYAVILVGNDNELTGSSWVPKPGERVEVRTTSGRDVRRGVIEAVMTDNSGFWLAADGVEARAFVLLDDKEQSIRRVPVLTDATHP